MTYAVEVLVTAPAEAPSVQTVTVRTPHGPDAAQAIAKARALEGMASADGLTVQAGNMEIREERKC